MDRRLPALGPLTAGEMSGYHYEFLAVGHPLDERQRTEAPAQSVRSRVTLAVTSPQPSSYHRAAGWILTVSSGNGRQ